MKIKYMEPEEYKRLESLMAEKFEAQRELDRYREDCRNTKIYPTLKDKIRKHTELKNTIKKIQAEIDQLTEVKE